MPRTSKEQQILRAAEDLFTRQRFHEVTMDDVCHAAGVGKGTIYRYFKDKDDLFSRLVTSGFEELIERIQTTADEGEDFEEQLKQVLAEIRSLFTRRRPLFRMMHSEEMRLSLAHTALREQMGQHRQEIVRSVADVLRRGVEAGVIRSDLPPERIAAALLGMLRTFVWQSDSEASSDQVVEQVVDLFLRGAACPQAHLVEQNA